MKKSLHAFIYKTNDNQYVVYNNFLFEPILMSKDEISALDKDDFSNFSEAELKLLSEKGIIVHDYNQDKIAEQIFVQSVLNSHNDKITLLYIIPTNMCNLACSYCFIGKLDNTKIQMSENTINNLVCKYANYLIDHNVKEAVLIFYGAEPLLNLKAVEEIITKFNQYSQFSIQYNLITNGTLINQSVIDVLEKNKISLGISVDGPKEINDVNRVYKVGENSVYDKVKQSIDLLSHSSIDFNLSITITKEVLLHQNDYINWIISLNVKNISFNLLHFNSFDADYEEYYTNASKFIIKANEQLSPLGFTEDRFSRKANSFYNHFFKYNDCAAIGANQLCVSPNGDITVCHGYWNSDKEKCGNINTDLFEDILNNPDRKKWIDYSTVKNMDCIRCSAFFICGKGCIKQAEDMFGNKNFLDKGFCIHTKLLLENLLNNIIS